LAVKSFIVPEEVEGPVVEVERKVEMVGEENIRVPVEPLPLVMEIKVKASPEIMIIILSGFIGIIGKIDFDLKLDDGHRPTRQSDWRVVVRTDRLSKKIDIGRYVYSTV
jgi:hypothetical protein